jgi:hypothetical protein
MITVKLENWSIVGVPSNSHHPPEMWVTCLMGDVTGHPIFGDEKDIITTNLVALDIEKKIAKTLNTIYILGDIDKGFVDFLNKNNYKLENYSKNVEMIAKL